MKQPKKAGNAKKTAFTIVVSSAETLADAWERGALKEADGNFSASDALGLVQKSSWMDERRAEHGSEADSGSDLAQTLVTDAFTELVRRSKLLGDAYPFTVDPELLVKKTAPGADVYTYPFLLLLTYTVTSLGSINPTRLFEEVCAKAAAQYLGGKSIRFGWPRRDKVSFTEALSHICQTLCEGNVRVPAPRPKVKDGSLDVVAWRPIGDDRGSQLIALGQCAAGQNWPDKTAELQVDAFMKRWLMTHFLVDPVRMFFLPRPVADDELKFHSVEAGIMFDRARIALHAPLLSDVLAKEGTTWTRLALNQVEVA